MLTQFKVEPDRTAHRAGGPCCTAPGGSRLLVTGPRTARPETSFVEHDNMGNNSMISSIYSATRYVARPDDVLSKWSYDATTLASASKLTSSVVTAATEAGELQSVASDALVQQFTDVWHNLCRKRTTDFNREEWTKRFFSGPAVEWQKLIGYDKEGLALPLVKKVRAALGRAAFLGLAELPESWSELQKSIKEAGGGESEAARLVRGFRVALGIKTKGELAGIPALISPESLPEAFAELGKEGSAALFQILVAGFGRLEIEAALAEMKAGAAE
jgi:hypothetical protein